ncbi:hypothetical protein MASR1M12_25590 [Erysipelotrichia bacterium]
MKNFQLAVLCFVNLLLLAHPLFIQELPAAEINTNAHEAPHQGVLSEIEGCSIGHAEIKINDGTLHLWLLDGGNATERSVQSPDEKIPLSIIGPDQVRFEMVLTADPMKLAGEKDGASSRFTGYSDRLKNLTSFQAFGWLRFKGQFRPLRLGFPQGFSAESNNVGHCGHEHADGQKCSHDNHEKAGKQPAEKK